jgi:membrane protein required for colicin V production
MEHLPMNTLDIGVIAFLILSAITGLILGFVRGGLFVLSWLSSAITTILAFPHVSPYARQYIESEFFADLLGGIAVFITTLILLFLLSSVIGGWVRNSRLNALDRSLGMVSGIATASILLTGGYIIAENIWSKNKQPTWILEAKTLPLIRTGARALNNILPTDFQIKTKEAIEGNTSKTRKLIEKETYDRFIRPNNKNPSLKDRSGYDNKERSGIENLFDRTQ